MPARYKVAKRSGTHNWLVRYYVPREYQEALGKREIVRSLGTSDKSIADERALDVVKRINITMKEAQKQFVEPEGCDLFEPTGEQLEAAVREVYEAEVESDWEERSDPEHMALTGMGGKESSRSNRTAAKNLKKAASVGDYRVVNVDDYSFRFGFKFPENGVKKNRFHMMLAYAYAEAAQRWSEHDMGKRGVKPNMPELQRPKVPLFSSPSTTNSALPSVSPDSSKGTIRSSLRELWATHEMLRGARDKPGTITDRKLSIMLFDDFVGRGKPVAMIGKDEARGWRDNLYLLPKNATKIKAFKSLTFKDKIKLNEKLRIEPISERTIQKHVSDLTTFYKWLLDEGRVTENVFKGLSPYIDPKIKRSGEFSDVQLRKLFSSPLFTGYAGDANIRQFTTPGDLKVRSWRFWLPIIAAFSGARLGELVQLKVADIRKIDGILCFDIFADENEGKTTKSAWSNRLVPVHSELLRLGFVQFVEAQRLKGTTNLFPDLHLCSVDPRNYASKWFGKYFVRMQFEPDANSFRPKFHSFRHSAITRMSQELGDHEIQPLVGHEATTTTKGYRESATYSIAKRQKFIEFIQYSELDLSHLCID